MENGSADISRRSFLTRSTAAGAVVTAFTIIRPELVRGAGDERLKAGLVGCGGRGTEAAQQFLHGNENVELVAMGDIFEDHLEKSLGEIRGSKYTGVAEKVKVDPDHHFIGFDAYRKVLASDVDVVLLATPPGYRPEQFVAAVEAKKHIFAEKPFGTDPVGVRKVMAASKRAEELKLTVMSGAQRHHQDAYVETWKKVRDGAIGDIVATYGYWVGTPVIQQQERDPRWSDMVFQHRAWYSFVWIGGDQIVEQHLHNIDAINWFMGAHPVKVSASGGAAWRPREELYGNIYDHMSSDFTYANGVHLSSHCRQYPKGVYTNVSDMIVGAKGHSNGMDMGTKGVNPYVQEHINMIRSIRGEGPYLNYSQPIAESTLTAIMARESAYSGQEITWDQIMNSQLDLMPKELAYDVKMEPAPLPVPGMYRFA